MQSDASLRVDVKQLLDEFAERAAVAEEGKARLLDLLDASSQAGAAIAFLERTAAAQAEEIRDLQRVLSEAHALVIEERVWRLHHGQLQLHLLGGNCAQTTVAAHGSDEPPWQRELRHDAAAGSCFQRRNDGTSGGGFRSGGQHYPVPDAQTLASKLESLQARHEQEGRQAQEHIAKLLEDRRCREWESQAQCELLQARLDDAQESLSAVQAESQRAVRDCIIARQEQAETGASAAAAIAQLEVQRQETSAKHVRTRQQLAQQAEEARAAAADAIATAQQCRAASRKQAAARDKKSAQLLTDCATARVRAKEQVATLQQKLERALQGRRQLEHRRAMDVEGFTSDISLLRKVVGAVDRRLLQMRLADRLEHDERLKALLQQLQARVPGEVDAAVLEDVTNIAARRQTFEEAEDALGKVAETLDSMQQRVAPLAVQHPSQCGSGNVMQSRTDR